VLDAASVGQYDGLSQDINFGQARFPLDALLRLYHLALGDHKGAAVKLRAHKQLQRELQLSAGDLRELLQEAVPDGALSTGIYSMPEDTLNLLKVVITAAIGVSRAPVYKLCYSDGRCC
jgi:hypothetical protein